MRVAGEPIASRRLIPEFYEARGFRPAWGRPGQVEALAAASRRAAVTASTRGTITLSRWAGSRAARHRDWTRPTASCLLTDALVRLAYHLRFGKANPRELYPGWNFTRSLGAIDPIAALEEIVTSPALGEAVERYAPQLPAYRQLREALARYRAIETTGGWPRVEPGVKLEQGMNDPRVAALRKRLVASGDIERGAAEPAQFDAALETAVRRFQGRHGIEADGIVGRRTLAALNVGVAGRIDQLRVNLERIRWVAQDLAGDYLIVDIAGVLRPARPRRTPPSGPRGWWWAARTARPPCSARRCTTSCSTPPGACRRPSSGRTCCRSSPRTPPTSSATTCGSSTRPVGRSTPRRSTGTLPIGGFPHQIVQAPGRTTRSGN